MWTSEYEPPCMRCGYRALKVRSNIFKSILKLTGSQRKVARMNVECSLFAPVNGGIERLAAIIEV